MENHNDFNLFYRNYLGIDDKKTIQGIAVCVSNNRDLPLNKKIYYKIIITEYNGECVVSCSSEVEKDTIKNLCNFIKYKTLEDIIENKIHIKTYDSTCMYRMILNQIYGINWRYNCLCFYKRGDIKSITLFPGEKASIRTPMGMVE